MSALDALLRTLLFGVRRLPDSALRAGSRALFSASWRRFQEAVEHPREVQTARLLALVERAKDTAFGKEHGFGEIRSLEAYRARVPVRSYDALEPYVRRMVDGETNVLIPETPFFFGRTSGTTGSPKYIPVTPLYVSEYRTPRRVWARQVMQAFPGLVRGTILTMHSPKIEGRTPGGAPFGSVTVGMTATGGSVESAVAGTPLDSAPRSLFLLEDFELKYYAVLRLAAQSQVSLAAAVNPSTLVLLAKKLDEHAETLARDLESGSMTGLDRAPEPLRSAIAGALRKDPKAARRIRASKDRHGYVVATDLWPKIAGLVCWKGGSAPFYLAQLERWFPRRQIMDYGFIATEGGFSIPLSPKGASGVVSVLGHVLEFFPEGALEAGDFEASKLADELEPGQRYRVVVTGAHGLYRYDINDVVECTGRYARTAEIVFLHKGGNMLSLTGEKIAESHVVEAVRRAEATSGVAVEGFCVSCELGEPPRYVLGAEGRAPLSETEARALLSGFESALREVNVEYAAKRDSLRLGAPKLMVLEAGAFERERGRRVTDGAPDSHVKPPHLVKEVSGVAALGVVREVSA